MIIIKPKMLEGKFKIDKGENALYSAGLISGALGSRIELKVSANYRLSDEQKYLTKIIKESGCVVKKSKNMYLPLCSGMMNSVKADAEKLGENIFFAVVFLCFLKGNGKIYNFESLGSFLKDRLFMLIGSLKKMSADITVKTDEILFGGKQVLSGAEVSAHSDFDIFAALCTAAQRCEGNVTIRNISGIDLKKYESFKTALLSAGAELKEKEFVLKMRKNIVLTGMSGAGKSHIGKIVAQKLGLTFFDSDAEFEKEENMAITDVFKEKGEEYFHIRETEVIERLSKRCGCVISTGGGAVLKEENIRCLKENGIIFYLERDIETIAKTVDGSGRPLFKGGKNDIIRLFKSRRKIYETTADYTVSNNGAPESAAEEICNIYEDVVI